MFIVHCSLFIVLCSLFIVIVNVQCCDNIVGGLVLRWLSYFSYGHAARIDTGSKRWTPGPKAASTACWCRAARAGSVHSSAHWMPMQGSARWMPGSSCCMLMQGSSRWMPMQGSTRLMQGRSGSTYKDTLAAIAANKVGHHSTPAYGGTFAATTLCPSCANNLWTWKLPSPAAPALAQGWESTKYCTILKTLHFKKKASWKYSTNNIV